MMAKYESKSFSFSVKHKRQSVIYFNSCAACHTLTTIWFFLCKADTWDCSSVSQCLEIILHVQRALTVQSHKPLYKVTNHCYVIHRITHNYATELYWTILHFHTEMSNARTRKLKTCHCSEHYSYLRWNTTHTYGMCVCVRACVHARLCRCEYVHLGVVLLVQMGC